MSDLKERLAQWLTKQGHPLELETVATLEKNEFSVRPGAFVEDFETGAPREIDVIADLNANLDDAFVRLSLAIECKWSGDKPWVLFSSSRRIAPSACIAQSFASRAADAILWAQAANPLLPSLSFFSTPDRPCYGGRQAFSDNRDLFYSAVQSVVSAARSQAAHYDRFSNARDHLQRAVMVFPVIVVKGALFEAHLNAATGALELDQRSSLRMHWRGSPVWRLHATLDIVSSDAFPAYAEKVRADGLRLLTFLQEHLAVLRRCFADGDLSAFEVTRAPRGFLGRPRLLEDLSEALYPGRPQAPKPPGEAV